VQPGQRGPDRGRVHRRGPLRRLGLPAAVLRHQRVPRARHGQPGRAARPARRRLLPGRQQELVDRQPAAELPVRDRGGLGGPERPAAPAGPRLLLRRHNPPVLGVGRGRRRPGRVRDLRHAVRQGRAQGVGLPVPRRRARAVPRRPDRGGLMEATMQPWAGRDRALEALEAALAGAAADHVEIFLAGRIGHHTRFAATRIHQPQTIVECQVMVRAVAGTGSARVAVSDLSRAAAAVSQAAELARRRDGRRGAAAPYGVAGPAPVPDLTGLWHEATQAWDEGARSGQAGQIMDGALAAGGTAAGVLTAAVTELAVVTSAGQRAYAAATEAGFALTVRVGEASSYGADLGRDVRQLEVGERAALTVAQAARAAAAPLIPVPDGVHDVVFGGLATGELIGFLPDFGFTAPAVAAGIGLAATRPGAELAPAAVTVADDALGGAGLPFPFDFEGTPRRRVELIAAGRVGGAVSDLASAGATGGVSTGHAHIARESSPAPEAASLIMSPGQASEDDLI